MLAELTAAGVPLMEVDPMPDGARGLRGLPGFVRALRALGPSVFHAHLPWMMTAKAGLAGALIARVPFVVATVHAFPEFPVGHLARAQRRIIARGVDRFVVASHHGGRRLADWLPASRDRITVIPHGVDVPAYERDPDPELRSRLSHGGRRRVVLLVGRMDGYKGHADLLQAARGIPDAQIVLAGDGPERPALVSLAASLGMTERVTFLGFRHDVPDLLAASDLAVLPTLNEAFGLALIEAMAASRPVISTRVGGPEEIVRDGETGLLVPPGDPPALAAAMRRVLDDPSLAERLARAGHARAEERFSVEGMRAGIVDVYRESLSGRPRPRVPAGAR